MIIKTQLDLLSVLTPQAPPPVMGSATGAFSIKFDAVLLEAAKTLKISGGDTGIQVDPQTERALKELVLTLSQKPTSELEALRREPVALQQIVSGVAQEIGLNVTQSNQLSSLVELVVGKTAENLGTIGTTWNVSRDTSGEISGPQGGSPGATREISLPQSRVDDKAAEAAQSPVLAGELVKLANIFSQPILVSTRTGGASNAENGLSPALNQVQSTAENVSTLQVVVSSTKPGNPAQVQAPSLETNSIVSSVAKDQIQPTVQTFARLISTPAAKDPLFLVGTTEPKLVKSGVSKTDVAGLVLPENANGTDGWAQTIKSDSVIPRQVNVAKPGTLLVETALNTQELLGPLPQADPKTMVTVRSVDSRFSNEVSINVVAPDQVVSTIASKQPAVIIDPTFHGQASPSPQLLETAPNSQTQIQNAPLDRAPLTLPEVVTVVQRKERVDLPSSPTKLSSHNEDFSELLGTSGRVQESSSIFDAGLNRDSTNTRSLSQPQREAVLSQVLDTVTQAAQQDSRLRIKLSPEWLGEVDVELSMEGSRLTARLVTSRVETHEILVNNLQHFKHELEQQGLVVRELSIGVRAQTQQQGQAPDQGWRWQQQMDKLALKQSAESVLWGAFSPTAVESHNTRFSALA